MKRNFIVLGTFITLISCLASVNHESNVSKEQLYGAWSFEDVAWLRFTEDSVYFVDEEGEPSIKYSVNEDTLVWYFDGNTQKDKFKIVQDTIFIFVANEGWRPTYVRIPDDGM